MNLQGFFQKRILRFFNLEWVCLGWGMILERIGDKYGQVFLLISLSGEKTSV